MSAALATGASAARKAGSWAAWNAAPTPGIWIAYGMSRLAACPYEPGTSDAWEWNEGVRQRQADVIGCIIRLAGVA